MSSSIVLVNDTLLRAAHRGIGGPTLY